MKYLFILCLCLGCKAPMNLIDINTSVRGKVQESNGRLLNHVYVEVQNSKVNFNTGSLNDFVILGVSKDITLIFQHVGYISRAITCSPGCSLVITMQKDTSFDPRKEYDFDEAMYH